MHVPEQSTGTNHMQELSHSTCTPLLYILVRANNKFHSILIKPSNTTKYGS